MARTWHSLCVVMFAVAAAICADSPQPGTSSDTAKKPTPEELVRDLGSPIFSVREKASRELWKLGAPAMPALREALRNSDPEIVERAQELLKKFDAGIFPDTPPEVLQQIREFNSGNIPKQLAAMTALIQMRGKGTPALRSLLSAPFPDEQRANIFDHLHWTLRQEVPLLLLANELTAAEELLSLNTIGRNDQGLIDYAVFLKLRDRANAVIPELEARRKSGGPQGASAARALVFVYRAAGKTNEAKSLASSLADEHANSRVLYESLLEDLGQWSELADRSTKGLGPANSRDGLTIFRLRLANRNDEADSLIEEQKTADVGERGRFGSVDEATIALMLGNRPLDGIERMRSKRNLPHILADVLSARHDFKEALDLVGNGPAAKIADENEGYDTATLKNLYGTRKGKLLARLGYRDAASQVFNKLAEEFGDTPNNMYVLTQLLRAEMRAGRFDLACEHAGKALAGTDAVSDRVTGSRQDPFEALFEGDAEAGQYWWKLLRANPQPGEAPGATMRLVRALLVGTATPGELDRALKLAAQDIPADSADTLEGIGRALAISTAYRASGRPALAIPILAEAADKIGTPNPKPDDEEELYLKRYGRGRRSWVFGTDERFKFWMELGDLLTEQKQFREAARRYEQGWRRHPDNPVLLFLAGKALMNAGDALEGQRRIDLSHWVALGNARLRGRFLEELLNRGHWANAKRERDLIREAGWLSEMFLGNVWNQVARASVVLKDFAVAADANRRAIHYLLRSPGVSYVEGYAYLTVPEAVRVYDARQLLGSGKIDNAVSLANECLTILPGNNDVALGMVPELDKLGRKADAEKLFRRTWDSYAKLIETYPDSAWARHQSAWLAAGCRRELDAALHHAKKAVELEPEIRPFQEGLAEVQFRRGERATAVSMMQKLVAAEPKNYHYQRQLERYRTAAFDSPLPETGED